MKKIKPKKNYWSLLLIIPFAALLYLPFYNHLSPRLFGIPFFYWYQFLWIPLTSLLIWIVYKKGGHCD